MSDSKSTLAELKALAQAPTSARNRLTYLFDEGKFTELDAFAKTGGELFLYLNRFLSVTLARKSSRFHMNPTRSNSTRLPF